MHQDTLGRLLKTAQQLQVKGLIEQSGAGGGARAGEVVQVGSQWSRHTGDGGNVVPRVADHQRARTSTRLQHISPRAPPALPLPPAHAPALRVAPVLGLLAPLPRQDPRPAPHQDPQPPHPLLQLGPPPGRAAGRGRGRAPREGRAPGGHVPQPSAT